MKTITKITLSLSILLLSSCGNPFNLKGLEKDINAASPFSEFRNAVIVSGAAPPVTTAGGYKVTSSVGDVVKVSTATTGSGYHISNFVTFQ